MDEPMVDTRFLGQTSRSDPRMTDLDEQPLGRVEKRSLGGRAGYFRRSHRMKASTLARQTRPIA
jgi:hypothetical protein